MRDRGLIIVYTGDGKGKTTAALGMALRTVGWGGKVEHKAVEKYIKDITIIPAGSGFVGIMGDKKSKEEHKASAINAFELAKKEIMSKKWPLVILDEINGAIEGKLVELKEVLALLASKPEEVTVVLTGREAKSEIMEAADLVTEMKKIKHPYDAGILAKKGVDY
ncbi:MAG: Cob(I)alamin adenosyltransferase [Candidatus Gottesmanbacteria bacterium GW2011_GWA1_42_26]|nr:MAG: Cob(I)alamin adenosyltransferase [Candidatus Gottesmanbacteria bacterium GW2011_GWA1_42_26]